MLMLLAYVQHLLRPVRPVPRRRAIGLPSATRVLLLLAWVCVVLSPVPRRRAIGLPSATVGATRVLVLLAWVCVVLSSAAAGGSLS